ncbi:glycosyltransferase family 39 protein [Polaribacter vadi]|uniref:glycosyltransferase family 39 protein n=1 Tax=Polaribacter TaxID=52959 RepID=UPI001C0A3864|nr:MULTISPECIES: glycosyltransferase family 39 protein [Polaribacter]MBU3010069.1 glycosyltransferase family 39 protein [Polaribacter vadi]MDO6739876.1 glycosyltransferase family 39 protein [Polaribacter sp. 1_MG-2023]
MSNFLSFIKNNKAISWVLGFQLFRLILLPFMGLMPQDAYYYLYGQNLSLSYFDHPGMIGYCLRFFTDVFGQTVFVVKLTDFVITSLTLFSFYKLASYFLSKQKVENAIVLLASTLFISILSFNSTPDVPLLLFWTLSIICLYKAIFEEKKWYWIFGGIAMGLAFNSKYTALVLQIGLILFVIFSNKHRKLLFSPWFWFCLIISLAITFPVWYWNYQNEFASFAFQSSERTSSISEFKLNPGFFFGAIGHQLFLLLPVLFLVFITFTFKFIKRALLKFKLPPTKTLFLLAFFIPTFVGFFSLTPIYWVKLNWMMPSYITGIILAGMFISKKLLKIQVIFSVVFHFLFALQILFYLVPIKSDDTWVGWKELAIETEKLQEKYTNTFVFSDDNYKTSACLKFYLDDKVYAQNIIGLPALHFDYLGDELSTLNGKNAIFIDSDKRFKNKDKKGENHPKIDHYFDKVTELTPIIIKRNGKEIRKYWVFYCENYKANALTSHK